MQAQSLAQIGRRKKEIAKFKVVNMNPCFIMITALFLLCNKGAVTLIASRIFLF